MLNTISDSQLAILERNPEYRLRHRECPICGDRDTHQNTGEYYYRGERHDCPDDDYGHVALRLAKLYWLSFIPLEYQRLLWNEFPHKQAKKEIEDYLENFDRLRLDGIGYTIYGQEMGTGKTWGATYILRELAKRNYSCHFASFLGVRSYYEIPDPAERDFKVRRIREAEVLVLDEVKAPFSKAQRDFFEDKLEELLRDRTYMNFPTIVTSNMTMDQFEKEYPRCSSLLAGKNIELELKGEDARASGIVFTNNKALALKGETRPIT